MTGNPQSIKSMFSLNLEMFSFSLRLISGTGWLCISAIVLSQMHFFPSPNPPNTMGISFPIKFCFPFTVKCIHTYLTFLHLFACILSGVKARTALSDCWERFHDKKLLRENVGFDTPENERAQPYRLHFPPQLLHKPVLPDTCNIHQEDCGASGRSRKNGNWGLQPYIAGERRCRKSSWTSLRFLRHIWDIMF